MKNIWKYAIVVILFAAALFFFAPVPRHTSVPAVGKEKPFEVRAFHVEFKPRRFSMSKYADLCDQAARKGYNMIIFALNELDATSFTIPKPGEIQPDGYTLDELRALIGHARSLHLDPVLEIKVIGKQRTTLGGLAKKLPGLLRESNGKLCPVLNPDYLLPDGRDVFQAIVFPEIDQFIGLYGSEKPKYLLLGIDEIDLADLEYYAKQKGIRAAALLADSINRITEHVLAQGITPILWGDMLLSHQLAKPGHGVEGFDHDPRMRHGGFSYNADNPIKGDVSVVTAMNTLRNRDRIIVADWQYGKGDSNGEYPSVDYFQKLGFKDVWGTTWSDLVGVQKFSGYAARKGCGGMIASTWFLLFSEQAKPRMAAILENSIIFFKSPGFSPPIGKLPFTVTGEGARQTLFSPAAQEVVFRAQLPAGVVPREPTLSFRNTTGGQQPERRIPMKYLPKGHVLESVIGLSEEIAGHLPAMFDTRVEFTCDGSGWLLQDIRRNSFGIADHLPTTTGKAPSDAWFYADFSGLPAARFAKQLIAAEGKYGTVMTIETPGQSDPGALDCKSTEACAYPPPELWDAIYNQGLRLRMEFRVDEPGQKTDHSALLSFGTYSSGFRILLNSKNQVLLQFAEGQEDGRPTWILFPAKVPMGEWTSLELTLSPPNSQKQRTASFRVGDAEPMVVPLARDLVKSSSPVGFGVEFQSSDPNLPGKKAWEPFPGMIRKVDMAACPEIKK